MVQWEEGLTPSPCPSDSIDSSEEDSTIVFDETESTALKMLSPNENGSWIRAAIPHLPRRLAAFYLVLNIGLPGSGTVLSGWSTLCVGKSRMPNHSLMIMVNTSVGVAQFLTIPWLLVGWFWSIAWGIILWLLAGKAKQQHKPNQLLV
uniref:Uncharacterized protein n=1 Tax=Strigamia maritima TaxID=126957 RepID=T1IPR8_STRMM